MASGTRPRRHRASAEWAHRLAAVAVFLISMLVVSRAVRAAVAACGQPVMGTILQVTVVASDRQLARSLCADATAAGRHWDDVLTTWRADGELARLNRRAGAGTMSISADLATALRRMQALHRATGGAFDPAIAPLVSRWRSSVNTPRAVPAASRPHRLGQALSFDGGRATLARGARLDAGAIGKGIALDAIATMLRRRGVQAAFLDFGGSSQLAIGAPPGNPDGWKVVVAGLNVGAVHGVITLRDAALSTSRALGAGAEAGPVVDPRTGRPVPSPRVATVLAPDAASADAWSTALVVLGRAGMNRLAHSGVGALIEDEGGTEWTPGFPLEIGVAIR